MKIGFRWFGEQNDPVQLAEIRQIPGVSQAVTALYDVPVGEVWPKDRIAQLKQAVTSAGLGFEVIESVNVHDDIKTGQPGRDQYIENYQQTVGAISWQMIHQYDEKILKNPAQAVALCNEAAKKTAAMLEEETQKTLDKVLYEASCRMKNAYSRSDS